MSGYIRYKAERYLELGPEQYRRGDAFDLPPLDWETAILTEVEALCRQVSEGLGFSKETPLSTALIPASYALIELFHFAVEARRSSHHSPEKILDEFTCRHVITGQTVQLFVLVTSMAWDD